MRWRFKLEEYDYEIEYKPGRTNSSADALSRVQIQITNIDIEEPDAKTSTQGSESETAQGPCPSRLIPNYSGILMVTTATG